MTNAGTETSTRNDAHFDTSHNVGPGVLDHIVQFYESEDFLYSAVADFLAEGLVLGQPLLVIATPEHRTGFANALRSKGFDPVAARDSGQLTLLDARGVLGTFMVGTMPDAALFRVNVGAQLEASLSGRASTGVRAYGEMVDLLWRDGNPEAAIRLEELWNELAQVYTFELLCAYPMGNFYRESHGHHFDQICKTHGRVRPAESFATVKDADEMAREISTLQQQARALTTEIEHRKSVESALRDALQQRREAEDALRRSERELKDFLENAVEGLHWVGPDGTILWANRAELEMLGYSHDEYVGHHISEFHTDQQAIEEILRRLSARENLRELEAQLRRKDGSIRHVLINSNVLFQDDEFIHTRCFTRDITDRKNAEKEREQLLSSEQEARAEAERAGRMKDEFLAILSHELRTPLSAIIGWVHIVNECKSDEATVNRAFEVIARNASSQLHLIDDLLDTSRIITGKMQMRSERLDLAAVMAAAADTVRPAATAKSIDVVLQTDESARFVRGDADRLQQVVWNLLSNAMKFTPRHGLIELRLERIGAVAEISVRDTGAGIAAEFLPFVFERFRQADTTSSRTHGGLGLGLAIVRHLVEAHGGSVNVESPGEGLGTTFSITLPLYE